MAWFGGNLRNLTDNLTGQLSSVATTAASFTREVIAEGTEEVADHSTELQIAEGKVRRLETAVIALRAENERLGDINSELEEKAEASELQINSISSQYRSLLVEKEDQLKLLRQKQNDMQDFHHNIMSTPGAAMTTATSTSSLSGSAIMADTHDFDDVISSQQEINRLSSEVGRLRAECNHWKELAANQQADKTPMFHIGEDSPPPSSESAELKAKIKDLEQRLQRERDESQHQLSALQDSHSSKLRTMSRHHRTEVDDFQRKIESLERIAGLGAKQKKTDEEKESSDGGNELQRRTLELEELLRETRQQLGQLEDTNHQLEKENARLAESEKDSTRLVQTLKRKVDVLEKERGRLADREVKGQAGSSESVRKERDDLRQEVEHLMKVVHRQETELAVLLGSHEQASTSAMLADIHEAGRKFSTEEALRRSSLLREKQQIVNKMVEAGQKMSDSKATVATLQTASVDIGDQAAEIVSEIGCRQHQEITADFVSNLEKENDLLKHHVARLQNEIDELNLSCESLANDKQNCEQIIIDLNRKISGEPQSDSEVNADEGVSRRHGNDADSDSSTPVRHHIAYRRPLSPSDSSVTSDLSSRGEGWASEVDEGVMGPLAEEKHSLLENSDAVSFDGEFDDSIMFAGIKQRFPEAADAFRQQLNQFEMVRVDWESEKQALEEVLVKMRDQLKEKDRIIQDVTAEKGLMSVHKEHTEDLEERVKALEGANASLVEEKDTALKEMADITRQLNVTEGEKSNITASLASVQAERDDLQSRLADVESQQSAIEKDLEMSQVDTESELDRTREEKEKLESDLQQLDTQHQLALAQIITSRDNLIQEIKSKEAEISGVNQKLAKLNSEHDAALQEKRNLQEDLDVTREDLSASRADLLDSEQTKQEQAVAMTTLRTKLQSLQDENSEILKENQGMKRSAEQAAERIQTLERDIKLFRDGAEVGGPSSEALQRQVLDLTAKLEEVQFGKQVEATANESVAYLEHELSRTHHEMEELNKSIDERESKLQELAMDQDRHQELLREKSEELATLKEDNSILKDEVKKKEEELQAVREDLVRSEARSTALSSGIDDHRDAEAHARNLEGQLEKLKADLLDKEELLTSSVEATQSLEDLLRQREEDVQALAEENTHFLKNVEESKDKIMELAAMVAKGEQLEVQLKETEARVSETKADLEQVLAQLEQKSSKEAENLRMIQELEEEVAEVRRDLENKEMLVAEMMTEDKHRNTAEISPETEAVARSGVEIDEEGKNHDANMTQLRDDLEQKDSELNAMKEQLLTEQKNSSDLKSKLAEACQVEDGKNLELQELRNQVDFLQEKANSRDNDVSAMEKLQEEIRAKDSLIDELQQCLELNDPEVGNQVQVLESSLIEKEKEICQLNESVTKLVSDKELVEKALGDFQSQVGDLQRANQQKDEDVNRLRQEVGNITKQLQQPVEQSLENGDMDRSMDDLNRSGRIDDSLPPSSPFGKSPSGVFQGQDGAISDNEKHYEKIIQERDREIAMLQHERQNLLSSLGEKSTSTMGNSVLVDLHKNQMKVKTLESERLQMMAILNEKTREASNLKNEVHKLLKVISAQKSALEKAQDDVRELEHASRGPRDDMQKEALQKLSRIIQDKDLEIEALKQKNNSLLEVLQSEAPSNSSQISGVLSESEKLQKENTVLKEEKDQLVVSIHQKHQESLAYYEEVQRLVGVVNSEVQKSNTLQEQHGDLQAQVELLTESLNQSKMELEESIHVKGTLEREMESKTQRVSELEGQLMELDKSRNELSMRMEELENKDTSHITELSEKESEVNSLRQTVEELRKSAPVVEESLMKAEATPVQESPVQYVEATLTQTSSSPPPQYEHILQGKDAEIAELKSQLEAQKASPEIAEDVVKRKQQSEELTKVKEQLESQGHALMEMDGLVRDRSMELENRRIEVATLKQQVDKQDQVVLEQSAMLQKRNSQLEHLQQEMHAKTEEAQSLRQHAEQLSIHLQGLEQEVAKAREEATGQQHLVRNKDGELRQLQDLTNRLAAEIREKDFEISGLQDKSKTLTRLVDSKDADNQGEVRRLLGEAEAMQTQAQRFQHERDQALLALQKCQGDMLLLQEEAQTRGTNEQKLSRELSRLRDHLIQMEDTYTQDALQAEEREKALRDRLTVAEEQAHTSSSAVAYASKEAGAQIESLRDQLGAMAEQRDQALLQLSMLQEESQEYVLSLNNLQTVLEQFQREKDAAIAAEVEVYQLKAHEKERIAADLLKQNIDLEERLSSAQEARDIASRLSDQLDKKEEAMDRLKDEMHRKEAALEEFQKRFEEVSSSSETKVDKPLVKNLFMNYLSAPQAKKQEMVKLISSVLNFSHEDLEKVGLGSGSSGWLSGFFRRTPHPTPPSTPTKKANTSFTLQFVQFLENESTPKRSPRLPVDEMSQDRPRSSFNPFSAPVPQSSPFIQPGSPPTGAAPTTPLSRGPGAAHPFLRATGQPATPMGAVQPVIAAAGIPVNSIAVAPPGPASRGGSAPANPLGVGPPGGLTSIPTFTPLPVVEGATPKRGSPQTQAAVLSDILH